MPLRAVGCWLGSVAALIDDAVAFDQGLEPEPSLALANPLDSRGVPASEVVSVILKVYRLGCSTCWFAEVEGVLLLRVLTVRRGT